MKLFCFYLHVSLVQAILALCVEAMKPLIRHWLYIIEKQMSARKLVPKATASSGVGVVYFPRNDRGDG